MMPIVTNGKTLIVKLMNKQNLLALMVWAIDRDLLETPVLKAWELFQKDAVGCQKTYTDPSDELLFCTMW